MSTPLRVLIAEDSDDDVELLMRELKSGGWELVYAVAASEQELLRELDNGPWDLIISDYSMAGFDGMRCLHLSRQYRADAPFILVSGTVGEELAVDAMRAGAHDYVMKGRLNRLVPAIKRELKEAHIRSENRRMAEHLEFIAYYDPITALPNERLFRDNLAKILEKSADDKSVIAVASVEVSDLRTIRSALGVETTNRLMRSIAERLTVYFKASTQLSCLNENSFGLIAELEDEDHIKAFGNKFSEIFGEPFELGISRLHIDPNIGIAAFPLHGHTAEDLLRNAYVAVGQATHRSRCFHIYSKAEDRATPERLNLLGELRHAIRDNDLVLHYQPIVEPASGTVVAMEALVRWQHPVHGLVMPGAFLDGAEQSGLILPLTHWVIKSALQQSKRWEQAGHTLPLFINLSVRALEDTGLLKFVTECVRQTSVNPKALGFEVTESAIMQDYEVANRALHELHEMGFTVSLDDFGTGYSSLSYIQKLPIDHLKIDRSFITELKPHSDEFMIVKAIMDIATNLRLTVVAEGVERPETTELLMEVGCHWAQGYLFGRPASADQLLRHAQYRVATSRKKMALTPNSRSRE